MRKGVIPEIAETLLAQRKKAKADLAATTDPTLIMVLKAREKGFKVTGNSLYGYLGSKLAQVPFQPIAATTTAIGRRDNAHTQKIVKELFTAANGFAGDGVEVIGGDTDSVFLCMDGIIPKQLEYNDKVDEGIRLSGIAVLAINAAIAPPTLIEWEKLYLIFMNYECKKRYAGLKHVGYGKQPVVEMKGVECVRRGGSALVSDLVRNVLDTILHTGNANDAAALVRKVVDDVIGDKIELPQYTIEQTLRKVHAQARFGVHDTPCRVALTTLWVRWDQGRIDYSKPFTQQQVKTARELIGSKNTDPQLTYTELDQVHMCMLHMHGSCIDKSGN